MLFKPRLLRRVGGVLSVGPVAPSEGTTFALPSPREQDGPQPPFLLLWGCLRGLVGCCGYHLSPLCLRV